jgi:hypothetical protein
MPPDTRERPARQAGRTRRTTTKQSDVIVTETHVDRPFCRVVRAYCEALHWLQREPLSRATTCCRHYWDDVEVAS